MYSSSQIRRCACGARIAAVIAVLTVIACGGTKSELAKAIDAELKQDTVCYAHGNMGKAPTWPLRVRRQMELLGPGEMNPVLAAMQEAGYVTVTPTEVQSGWVTEIADVIAPTEDAKKWWDNATGWCIGTKAVAEVKEWTPPEGQLLQVTFTWKLVKVPSWARKPAFERLDGMSKPIEDMAIVQQTSSGWKVGL